LDRDQSIIPAGMALQLTKNMPIFRVPAHPAT
jgi:hypothetical protein